MISLRIFLRLLGLQDDVVRVASLREVPGCCATNSLRLALCELLSLAQLYIRALSRALAFITVDLHDFELEFTMIACTKSPYLGAAIFI